ncbi:MAG: hypothetical protein WC480_00855 [Patescibacteria group bacterium]
MNKKTLGWQISAFILSGVFIFAAYHFAAAVYAPGDTLDPECEPGAEGCTVTAPAISGENDDITSLTGLTELNVGDGAFTITVDEENYVVSIDETTNFGVGDGVLDVDVEKGQVGINSELEITSPGGEEADDISLSFRIEGLGTNIPEEAPIGEDVAGFITWDDVENGGLDVWGVSIEGPALSFVGLITGETDGPAIGFTVAQMSEGEFAAIADDAIAFGFSNGDNDKILNILGNGNVGIGTDEPDSRLTIEYEDSSDLANSLLDITVGSDETPIAGENYAGGLSVSMTSTTGAMVTSFDYESAGLVADASVVGNYIELKTNENDDASVAYVGYQATLTEPEETESPAFLKAGYTTYTNNGDWDYTLAAVNGDLILAPYAYGVGNGYDAYLQGGDATEEDGGSVYIYGGAAAGEGDSAGNVILAYHDDAIQGNVGIGTDSPMTLLHIQNDAAGDMPLAYISSGSSETPISDNYVSGLSVEINATATDYGIDSTFTSQGLEANAIGLGYFAQIQTNAADDATSKYIGYFSMMMDTVGSPAETKIAFASMPQVGNWDYTLTALDSDLVLAPYAFQTVGGNDAYLQGGDGIGGEATDGGTLYLYGGTGFGGGANGNVALAYDGTEAVGLVGVGTSTPLTQLDVAGGMRAIQLTYDPCDGDGYPEGTLFYNDANDYYCFCNAAMAAKQLHSPATACFE